MNELFAEKLVTDRRTYFFDVKETREGSMYVVIGEVAQFGNDTARHRVMVFEENIEAFLVGLHKSMAHIRRTRSSGQSVPALPRAASDGEELPEPANRGNGGVREMLGRFALGRREPPPDQDSENLKATLKRIETAVEEIREHFS